MIFFFNSQSELIKFVPEKVYQGSNKANRIWFIAPTGKNTVAVSFRLPNGKVTERTPMTPTTDGTGLENANTGVKDENNNYFYAWYYDVNKSVTAINGEALLQFFVYSQEDELVATQSVSFTIEKGVAPNMPPQDPDLNSYEQILKLLSAINNKLIIDGDGTKVLNNKGEYVNLQELAFKELTVTDDLNTLITHGAYRVANWGLAQNVPNLPVQEAGILYVYSGNGANLNPQPYDAVTQRYETEYGDIWIRGKIYNTVAPYGWLEWQKILTTADEIGGSSITVDSEMSDTSTNPVQNKVVKEALDRKISAVEYSKETPGVQGSDGKYTGLLYGVDHNNNQIVFPVTPGLNATYTVPLRNHNGNFYVSKVILDYECANKKYVDDLFNSVSNSDSGALVITDTSFPNGISIDTAKAILTNFYYAATVSSKPILIVNRTSMGDSGNGAAGVVVSREHSETYTDDPIFPLLVVTEDISIVVGGKIYKYKYTVIDDGTEEVSAPTIYDIENKLDKYVGNPGNIRLYGVDTDGKTQILVKANQQNYDGQFIKWTSKIAQGDTDGGGVVLTSIPEKPYQAVPLIYAQENFSPKLYRHKIQIGSVSPNTGISYFIYFSVDSTIDTQLTPKQIMDLENSMIPVVIDKDGGTSRYIGVLGLFSEVEWRLYNKDDEDSFYFDPTELMDTRIDI